MNDENLSTICWQIRPARSDDLEALVILEQVCFAVPWHAASLEHDLAANDTAHYWVAQTDQGQVIAYAAYWQMMDEAEITHIAVMPCWRRKGIAKALLRHLINYAQADHLTAIRLEVRQSNGAAHELYRQEGFREIGRRRRYYSDNDEDAIIMLKIIGNIADSLCI